MATRAIQGKKFLRQGNGPFKDSSRNDQYHAGLITRTGKVTKRGKKVFAEYKAQKRAERRYVDGKYRTARRKAGSKGGRRGGGRGNG